MFEDIRAAEMDPGDFEWKEVESPWGSRRETEALVRPEAGAFLIDSVDNNSIFALVMAPGAQRQEEERTTRTWEDVRDAFREWLHYLKREIESPDLWGEWASRAALVEVAGREGGEERFAPDEQAQIARHLYEVGPMLQRTHDVTPEQLASINAHVEYLVEASARLGRKDWANIAVGTLFTIAVDAGLKSDAMSGFFRFVWRGLAPLFGPPLPELPIG